MKSKFKTDSDRGFVNCTPRRGLRLGHSKCSRLIRLALKLVPVLVEFLAQLANSRPSKPKMLGNLAGCIAGNKPQRYLAFRSFQGPQPVGKVEPKAGHVGRAETSI